MHKTHTKVLLVLISWYHNTIKQNNTLVVVSWHAQLKNWGNKKRRGGRLRKIWKRRLRRLGRPWELYMWKKVSLICSKVKCGKTTAIIFITFWGFLMYYQIFLPPQTKKSVIIRIKHGIYELTQELFNEIRLRILGNWKGSEKSQNFIKF